MAEQRSVRIVSSQPIFRRENFLIPEPGKPLPDPEALLKQHALKPTLQERDVHFGCPACRKTFKYYDVFAAHALPCYARNRKVRLDITKKKFTGATPEVESA